MANMAQIGNALETGNGVYKGNPLFVLADGQVVDFDGKEVAPAFYADDYVIADQSTKKIYTKDTTWGDGVSLAAGKLYTDGTDLYVFGSGSLTKI